jgi:hypothetical protein
LFVIATPTQGGWFYRVDYPYYSWAETVVRPKIERRDLSHVFEVLNEKEGNVAARWQIDSRELSSAAKLLDGQQTLAPSKLKPEEVAAEFAKTTLRAAGSSI